jgi:tRNA modification GTPase
MHKLAMQQMRGGYSEEIRKLRDKLLHFVSLIELELDFSDEDVEFANRDELIGLLREIINVIDRLTKSFAVGNAIKKGSPVAIVGKPNVGKSTLLNALLNDDKAIVSDIAGTTRDAIEDTMTIGGVLFRFIDTAGLRHTTDSIEILGIERSRKKLEQASIALLVADYTEDLKTLTETINNLISEIPSKDSLFIVLLNKEDLLSDGEKQEKLKQLNIEREATLLPISAKGKLGLEELENLLIKYASIPENLENNSIVSNVRHYGAFIRAQEALGKALKGINTGLSEELISFEIREAIQHLGNIIGDISDTDVLSNIFSKFCIGK